MTAEICKKLINLESEIAELNSKLNTESQGDSIFKMHLSRKKINENVNKTKKLQTQVSNLIQMIETQLQEN